MIFDLRTTMSKDAVKPDGSYNIIFMGTGSFAIPIVKTILEEPTWNLVATVTKPDKKIGRGSSKNRVHAKGLLKEYSLTHNIPVLQPEHLDEDMIAEIKELNPDTIIVASYGKILPQELLDIPQYGILNIHASLLPKFRGASPIQNTILLGEKETGITLMRMDHGLDTGDIIAQSHIAIDADDTTQTLTKKLAHLSTEILTENLTNWLTAKIPATPQNDADATLCQLIERTDGHVTWLDNTEQIYNRYRALNIWPGIFGFWQKNATDTLRIKLADIALVPELTADLEEYKPGTIFQEGRRTYIRTRDHAIEVKRVQREGGTELAIADFINGNPTFVGSTLI